MNKTPDSKRFWRLAGPILLYWVIEFVAQMIASLLMIIPNASQIADSLSSQLSDTMTDAQIEEAMLSVYDVIWDIFQNYEVQLLAVVALCTIPLNVWFFRKDRKRETAENIPVNKKAEGWRYIWLVVLAAAVNLGVNALAIMTDMAFSDSYEQATDSIYAASFAVQIIGVGIIVPIAEELIYRGVFYKRCREQMKFWQAALCASILFSLSHTTTLQLIYTMGLGMLLAYVYEKYGSFKAPVLLHIMANIVSLTATETGFLTWMSSALERPGIAVVVCAFVGAVMFVLIQKIQEKPDVPGDSSDTSEQDKPKITLDMFR